MLLTSVIGSLLQYNNSGRTTDMLPIEWFETSKRILHKQTAGGKKIVIKRLEAKEALKQDDVLYAGNDCVIAIDIIPADVIIISPQSMYEMASVCYETGNKHLPLFWDNEQLLVPFELPLFKLFIGAGFKVEKSHCKLLHPLKTTVAPHASSSGTGLFTKIMQLTSQKND